MPYRVKKINSDAKLQKFYRKWPFKKKTPVNLQLDGVEVENPYILCRVAECFKVKQASVKNVFTRENGLYEFLTALEENSANKPFTLDISENEFEHICCDVVIALIRKQKVCSLTLPYIPEGDLQEILEAISKNASKLRYLSIVSCTLTDKSVNLVKDISKKSKIQIKYRKGGGFWRRVKKRLSFRNAQHHHPSYGQKYQKRFCAGELVVPTMLESRGTEEWDDAMWFPRRRRRCSLGYHTDSASFQPSIGTRRDNTSGYYSGSAVFGSSFNSNEFCLTMPSTQLRSTQPWGVWQDALQESSSATNSIRGLPIGGSTYKPAFCGARRDSPIMGFRSPTRTNSLSLSYAEGVRDDTYRYGLWLPPFSSAFSSCSVHDPPRSKVVTSPLLHGRTTNSSAVSMVADQNVVGQDCAAVEQDCITTADGAAMRSRLPSYNEAIVRNCGSTSSVDAGLTVKSRLPVYCEAVMRSRFRSERSIVSDEISADSPCNDTNSFGLNTSAISDDRTEATDDTTNQLCGVTGQAESAVAPGEQKPPFCDNPHLEELADSSTERESVKGLDTPRSRFDLSTFLHESDMNSSVVPMIVDRNAVEQDGVAVEQECVTTVHDEISADPASSDTNCCELNTSVISDESDDRTANTNDTTNQHCGASAKAEGNQGPSPGNPHLAELTDSLTERDSRANVKDETSDEKNEQSISKPNLPTKDLNNVNAGIRNLHPGQEDIENIGKLISSSASQALQSQQVFKSPFSADIGPDGGEIPLNFFRLNIPKGCFKNVTKLEGILEIDPSKNPKGYIPITPLLFLKNQHPLKPFSAKVTSQCINSDLENVKNTTVHVLHLPDGKMKWDVIDSLSCGHEAEIQIKRFDCGPIMFAMREELAESQKFVIQCSLYADSDNNFTFLFHLKNDLSDNEFSVMRIPGESRFNFYDFSAERDDTIRAEITSAENVTFEHNGVGEFRVDEQFLTQKWWQFKTYIQNEHSAPDGKLTITGRIFLNNMESQKRGRFRYTLKSHSGRFTENNIDIRRLEGNVAFNS